MFTKTMGGYDIVFDIKWHQHLRGPFLSTPSPYQTTHPNETLWTCKKLQGGPWPSVGWFITFLASCWQYGQMSRQDSGQFLVPRFSGETRQVDQGNFQTDARMLFVTIPSQSEAGAIHETFRVNQGGCACLCLAIQVIKAVVLAITMTITITTMITMMIIIITIPITITMISLNIILLWNYVLRHHISTAILF